MKFKVCVYPETKECREFCESIGYPPQTVGKSYGWFGEMDECGLWTLAELAFTEGFAVKIYKSTSGNGRSETTILMIDDNRYHFKQR